MNPDNFDAMELGGDVLWIDDRIADLSADLRDQAITDQEEQGSAEISDPSWWQLGCAADHTHAPDAAVFFSFAGCTAVWL